MLPRYGRFVSTVVERTTEGLFASTTRRIGAVELFGSTSIRKFPTRCTRSAAHESSSVLSTAGLLRSAISTDNSEWLESESSRSRCTVARRAPIFCGTAPPFHEAILFEIDQLNAFEIPLRSAGVKWDQNKVFFGQNAKRFFIPIRFTATPGITQKNFTEQCWIRGISNVE